jgi:hypothetical protein
VDGDVSVNLDRLMEAFDRANLTSFELPIDNLVESILNTSNLPSSIAHNFTVFDSFDVPDGKFGDTLGNIALIDCNYMNRMFATTYN